jgi:ribosomal protein S24E
MANGQQLSNANFERFTSWLASKTDDDFRQLVNQRDGVLSRKEIALECGFSGSALNQNPRIKDALLKKEMELRASGILPSRINSGEDVSPLTVPVSASRGQLIEVERLRRLEVENASLKAENQELKRQLDKFAVISEVLSTTGRLPR